MVTYVCRTCLYVGENEFSFKKIFKVQDILEMFIPQIKTCIGKYSLLCEQCYYFLKNVEKFKEKCEATQKKVFNMNLETIKANYNAIIYSIVTNENSVNAKNSLKPMLQEKVIESAIPKNSSLKKANDTNNDITLHNLLNSSKPFRETSRIFEAPTLTFNDKFEDKMIVEKKEESVSDDLLQLFDNYEKDTAILPGFRDFAIKQPVVNNWNKTDFDMLSSIDGDEEDEYMTRNDLVEAGILTKLEETKGTESDDDIEIIEDQKVHSVELKMSSSKKRKNNNSTDSTDQPASAKIVNVKKEYNMDENPGFFNKQDANGAYKCRLCYRKYKTSNGLYNHTKLKHKDQIRLFHCEKCSFFSMWKTSLKKHYNVFHGETRSNRALNCVNCSFQTLCTEELQLHNVTSHI